MSSLLLGAALLLGPGIQPAAETSPTPTVLCAPLTQGNIQDLLCRLPQPREQENVGFYVGNSFLKPAAERPLPTGQEELCAGEFFFSAQQTRGERFGINYRESAKVLHCGPALYMRVL